MTELRYPEDTANLGPRYPYTKIRILRFRERNFVVDDETKLLTTVSENKEYLGTIILPLPQDVSNSYSLDWEMSNMQGLDFLQGVMNSNSVVAGITDLKNLANLGAIVGGGLTRVFAQKTPNPKKQALFNGINPRGFSLTYSLVPHSLNEAEIIEKIVKTMTENSLPELTETEAFFKFPSEFEIEYVNTVGFPKYSPLVCTSVETNYSSNSMQLFKSGHAIQTDIRLSFLETDLRVKQNPGI